MSSVARRTWISFLLVACGAAPASTTVDGSGVQAGGGMPAVTPVQSTVSALVAATITTRHYARHAIDDAVSAAWFDAYLETLDPDRLYFLQSDIDEFSKWRDKLDDDVLSREPALEAAFTMRQRWLQRLEERVAYVNGLLGSGKFDFADPTVSFSFDRENAPWATTATAQDELWRLRVLEQVLRMKLGGDTVEVAVDRLKRRYHRLLVEQRDIDAYDVLEPYLAALTTTYDPHSQWMKPISKESFDIDMADTLTGIGAVLQADEGYVVIKELVIGGPAEASQQLHVEDRILAVAQDGADPVDVVDMRLDKVVQLIRGPANTKVTLTLWPADAKDPSERRAVTLVRDRVKLSRAASNGHVEQVDDLHVGVIEIPSFYEDDEGRRAGLADWGSTSRDVEKLITAWKAEGKLDALVLDLRMNGGGALDQAIELTGLFVDRGPVVQIKDNVGRVEVLRDDEAGVAWSGPLVVLTSEGSASASEIFAGAIQDYGLGLVVGSSTTHGKGSVQNLQSLDRMLPSRGLFGEAEAGSLKYTTHMFFRVEGGSTQVEGVHADIVLPSPYEGMEIKESDLDHALPWDRVETADYRKRDLGVDLTALRDASAWRVRSSVEFAFLMEDIAERQRLEALTTISLDEATRRAEIDRAERIDEARRNARLALGDDPEHPTDAILAEAVSIARDVARQRDGLAPLPRVAKLAPPAAGGLPAHAQAAPTP